MRISLSDHMKIAVNIRNITHIPEKDVVQFMQLSIFVFHCALNRYVNVFVNNDVIYRRLDQYGCKTIV